MYRYLNVLVLCSLPVMAPAADDQMIPCDDTRWRTLIGADVAAASVIPDPKRIIPPLTAVTRDYRMNRTNVDIDDNGIITRIWCG